MEDVVEDVEDQSENEGSPAHSQRYEDLRLCEVVILSLCVHHLDVPSSSHWVQHIENSHHCQTD